MTSPNRLPRGASTASITERRHDAPSAALATDIAETLALAHEMLGEPEAMTLLRQEGALRVTGWVLGRGRAECREAGQLAYIVGIDIVLMSDGLYAVSERTATDGVDGLSRLDAQCELFGSVAATRTYCEEAFGDQIREAARLAALDHAVRRWLPFRRGSASARVISMPFRLD